MDAPEVRLSRTELDFLHRLLLDLQRRLGDDLADAERVAALELALAEAPPELDAQVGLGAAVQLKLGGDGMVAWRQWREERRRAAAVTA